jgi:hypothetical protein
VPQLSDILDAAADESVPVAGLLRMVKVVASRIANAPLIGWVDKELRGYPGDGEVPDYRGPYPAHVLSEWSGLGSIARNVPLARNSVPHGMRDIGAFEVTFYEPVAELEQHAQSTGVIAYQWPSSAIAILNRQMQSGSWPDINPGYGLVAAYRTISSARAKSVLDNVRTRVVELALELEKVVPAADVSGTAIPDAATITNINNVITNIIGHGNTVGVDNAPGVQMAGVKVGNVESLVAAASALGLTSADVNELQEAIEADDADDDEPNGEPGSRVAKFMGRFTLGALKGTGQEGLKEVGKGLGDLILAYYGIK